MARPDTEYQVTPKGEEMAKRLAQTRGMKGMMGNKASPSSTAEQTDSRISKTPKKDPNYTTISGGVGRPLRQNDTVSDILAKMYNFMRKKYERDLKDAKKEKKYRVSLVKAKENRIEELIKLFKGKYKRKVSKDTKKEKTDQDDKKDKGLFNGVIDKAKQTVQSVKEGAKTILKKSTTAVSKVTPSVSTVAKVAVGGASVAGISSAAALSIKGETGLDTSQALKKVGQIVPNDPEPGSSSYGIFGINQKSKSIDSFVAQHPELGLKGKPGSKEFNDSWTSISQSDAQKMLDAQLAWYEANVSGPLKQQLSKMLPNNLANDTGVQTYLSDRRNQYGTLMEKQALQYAGDAKSPKEFIQKVSEFDKSHLDQAFKTYLKNHPNNKQGLINRIEKREQMSLQSSGQTSIPVPEKKSSVTVSAAPVETKPIPQQIKPPANNSGSSVMLNTNNTNILNGGTNYSVTQDNVKSTAPLLDLQYN